MHGEVDCASLAEVLAVVGLPEGESGTARNADADVVETRCTRRWSRRLLTRSVAGLIDEVPHVPSR
jgi:hypothetical protein